MENKKIKLTLSGIAKKSIENIELAKTQSKNSVIIEKKPNRFLGKKPFNKPVGSRPLNQKTKVFKSNSSSLTPRSNSYSKPSAPPITNSFERRKLAEQRATRSFKNESTGKGKIDKKKELKLTVSRALSDEIEARTRSMASLKEQN